MSNKPVIDCRSVQKQKCSLRKLLLKQIFFSLSLKTCNTFNRDFNIVGRLFFLDHIHVWVGAYIKRGIGNLSSLKPQCIYCLDSVQRIRRKSTSTTSVLCSIIVHVLVFLTKLFLNFYFYKQVFWWYKSLKSDIPCWAVNKPNMFKFADRW